MNIHGLIALSIVLTGVFFLVYGSVLFGSLIIVWGLLLQLKTRGAIKNIFPKPPLNMNVETKVLRFCIVAYWVSFTLAMLVGLYEEQGLPTEVVKFGEEEFDLAPSWLGVLMIVFTLTFMFGSIGISFLRSWGKKSFCT